MQSQTALRTQQILAEESGVANTIDPVAGSFAIEALTDEIEHRAEATIARIDALGGALAAIERGDHVVLESTYGDRLHDSQDAEAVLGEATLVLPPDVDEDRARRILTKAEETCLITRSLKGATHLEMEIERE